MSFLPALNADGSIVAFKSNATNLVSDDRNQSADVFVDKSGLIYSTDYNAGLFILEYQG